MIKDHFSNIFKRPLEKGIIIAEVGVNHEGDLEKAIEMIDQVKDSGGDAVKFQSYKAKLLARKDSKAYWDTSKENTKSQYELFSKYDTFDEKEFKILANYCNDKSIIFMSTPFDNFSADYINKISPIHKIASVDITNHILLSYAVLCYLTLTFIFASTLTLTGLRLICLNFNLTSFNLTQLNSNSFFENLLKVNLFFHPLGEPDEMSREPGGPGSRHRRPN